MEVWTAVLATALTSWERIGRCNRRSSEKVGATWWSLSKFDWMTEAAPEQRKIAGPTEPCCIVLGTLYCAINKYSFHLLVLRAVPCRAVIVMARMASHRVW